MPYIKITQPKLADAIVAELESMILEGSLQPGQKLPPERELAIQFQVSRPSLREAIQRLEARGLLYRRQGGGTYVQNALSKGIADPLFELLSTHPEAQYDLLEFRHALEGICAYYAALRGTDADFERIRQVQSAIEEAGQQGSLVTESAAVTQFYLAVARRRCRATWIPSGSKRKITEPAKSTRPTWIFSIVWRRWGRTS